MTEGNGGGGHAVRWSDGGAFGVVPGWVIDAKISDRSVRLYALLARLAGSPEASTFRGKVELAERLDCAKSSVEKSTAELTSIGALSTESRYDGKTRLANAYVVHAIPSPEGGSPAGAGGGAPARAGGSRARLTEGDPLEKETVEANASPVGGGVAERETPPLVKILGRDLGFDWLAEATGYDPGRRQDAAEIAVALYGSRKTGPGIRAEYFAEARRDHPDLLATAVAEDPEILEAWLANAIRRRAEEYRRKMDATLTPTALAKWWTRLPGMPDRRRRVTSDDILAGR